ncbi:TonB-dependent receptor plug domain-containing protein [Cycloclasticus pugetii]|uniref:TonB-dependent receptor plug domain-containing protein n=1 Tax=Cycloclasticus pugetii TaxID=34068 RepID=UPI00091E68A4|nr:TonB-dependent receptor [Cycloclasticus pugetii]SHJ06180.1 iron complex outermembrane recepter protein [Cycloclasticus pugetii]
MKIVKRPLFARKNFLFAFYILFITPFAVANDINDLSFFNTEIPIVLSATRLAQPQTEAPATITIIDRQLIKLSGAKAIPELFRLVPGFHVAHFRGNEPVVAYQGLSSEFPQGVQVLIDGRSVYSPLFGGVDWSNIPIMMEDIERIEVIRGPNGSSFGSNAFQAVINITTSHAVQTNDFQVKSTLGERGYQRTLLTGSHSFGDIDVRLSASHIDDNGYANNDDDSRHDSLTGRLDYQITHLDSLQLNFGIINTLKETHTPGTLLDPFDPPRNTDDSQHSIHAKWEHSTPDDQLFITQASYTRHLHKDKFTTFFDAKNIGLGFLGSSVSRLDFTEYFDRYDMEFEHQFHFNDQVRVSWGLGSRIDRVYMPLLQNSTQKFDNSIQRIFSNVEWRPEHNLIINIGALWEHSQLSGDDLSPRLAVNYLLTPSQSIRFSASHAIRAPVLLENNLNADASIESISTPGLVLNQPLLRTKAGLDPETVDSLEAGYHGLFFNNALTVDLKLFRNEYDNLIDTKGLATDATLSLFGIPIATADLGTKVQTVDNLHYANINGYEIELNYRPDANNLVHLGYAYNHTNVGRITHNDIENIRSSVPKDVFNILASHTFDNNLWASIAFYYTSSMEYLDSGNPQGPLRRLDINTGKSFNLSQRQEIDLSFNLQLALDKNKDYLNEFELDNRAFVELTYRYD